ncbi:MAG: hypothetical protein IPG58_16985 [Acidobacteria bacterium]|nr:hypothetical protein [Acidobacteriota bacterium]
MFRFAAGFTFAAAVSSFILCPNRSAALFLAPPKVDPQKAAEKLAKQVTLAEQALQRGTRSAS